VSTELGTRPLPREFQRILSDAQRDSFNAGQEYGAAGRLVFLLAGLCLGAGATLCMQGLFGTL
jgi:hypothetical protein